MTLLAKRYATALFALATQKGAVDAVAADLAALHAALASPGARALVTSPDARPQERAAVLAKLGSGRSEVVRSLIGVLQQRRRLDVLFDLHPAFRGLVMASRGEVEGFAESAHPIDAAELAALVALAGRLTGKTVQLSAVVRPELIGGVRLRIGNVLYDGSLRNSLEQLEQKLQKAAV